MIIVAVDPGQSGGIAWVSNDEVNADKMSETLHDLSNFFSIFERTHTFVWVENVGQYRPGNSGPAAAKFASHCGEIRGVLAALRIPFDKVTPAKWEHWLIGKPNYPKITIGIQGNTRKQILAKRKTERKRKIKEKVQSLYPHLKITLATADALGMLAWAIAQEKGQNTSGA